MAVATFSISQEQMEQVLKHELHNLSAVKYYSDVNRMYIECNECGEVVFQIDIKGHEDDED
jgi:hypothetical protein